MYLGIDVGGTHTDAVAVENGAVRASCKIVTRHEDLLASINGALEEILAQVDAGAVRQLNLSTTLSTNALVQGRIDDVGVLVSCGPGVDPASFAPGRHFYIIDGAIDHRGVESRALDKAAAARAVDDCRKQGVNVFAAVTKFSIRNPSQEIALKEAAQDADFVTMGHTLAGRLGFPRRVATAYFNCAVWRLYNGFVNAVSESIRAMGLNCPVGMLKADGGTLPLDVSRSFPVQSIFSGPAASVMGIIALCDIRQDSVIFDIGGTTTDIAVFAEGAPLIERDGISIGGHPTLVRALRVRSIAVGGDSALSVAGGLVRVGPQREGPSMAAGGGRPTLTDALNAAGRSAYGDVAASEKGIADMARDYGVDARKFAETAIRSAVDHIHQETRAFLAEINERPVYTIHEMLEDRRIVPNRVYLMGGPSHSMSGDVREAFKTPVIVPENASVANAVGAALTRTTHDVHLFADTQRGFLLIPSLELSEEVGKNFDLKAAEVEAKRRLGERLREIDASTGFDDVEITESSSFNMVSGYGTVGRNIRVKAQVKPGVLERINQS
ncbi:MAG: hydantoinase/oxoprolinase family protein [Desulfovibrionaceae bacterium]|jgi:N-methylhydantoinase A/oxoprolinase/acetone carboxylase beta subunit